ncbi:hypothetical protein E4U39_007630 [Claviceps sp. Clav50 group G5]|nr:hypothetical protein E4U39_007630 [Claviceps sp. Clav50 group G5]
MNALRFELAVTSALRPTTRPAASETRACRLACGWCAKAEASNVSKAFVDAEPLEKRGVASKTILMPAQGSGAKPAPNNLEQIQIDFIMGKKPVKQGNNMVPQYYCQSLRFTNKGSLRRRVLVTARGRTIFQGFMAVRESKVVNVPSGISQFNMEVEAAPKTA